MHLADEVIRTTLEHPFYVIGKGWTRTADLRVGDLFLKRNQREAELKQVARVRKGTAVYNLSVDGHMNYFVGNGEILTHNKPP